MARNFVQAATQGVNGDGLSLVVLVSDENRVPERMPHTQTGDLTLRAAKGERGSLTWLTLRNDVTHQGTKDGRDRLTCDRPRRSRVRRLCSQSQSPPRLEPSLLRLPFRAPTVGRRRCSTCSGRPSVTTGGSRINWLAVSAIRGAWSGLGLRRGCKTLGESLAFFCS